MKELSLSGCKLELTKCSTENMAIRPTIQAGNPILHAVAQEVADVSSADVERIITDLVDTMRAENLVGIAAPQLGESMRIFVTEVRPDNIRGGKVDPLRVYINPKISALSEETDIAYEGCGSVASAQFFGQIERSVGVTVEALDREGEPFTFTVEGFLSRVIQHEYDHLEGILFHEKITDLKSVMSREEYIKANRKHD